MIHRFDVLMSFDIVFFPQSTGWCDLVTKGSYGELSVRIQCLGCQIGLLCKSFSSQVVS